MSVLKSHIFLVGMSGAGKTSLGKRLAQNLNVRFVDTDLRVQELMGGLTVNEIYATLGEPFFRNAETGILISMVGQPPCVISTGGMAATNPDNVLIIRRPGAL